MGAVLVFLYKHAKAVGAWLLILGAWAIFVNAVEHSELFSSISTHISSVGDGLSRIATIIPESVTSINRAVAHVCSDGDSFGALMFWLCGFDVFSRLFAFIAAQISGIITFVVAMGTGSLSLFALMWGVRRTQRWASALGGGEVPSSASPLS